MLSSSTCFFRTEIVVVFVSVVFFKVSFFRFYFYRFASVSLYSRVEEFEEEAEEE